jgi:hypothetical protein
MSQGLCPSCGAAVKLTAGQTDTKCTYCDSVVTLQQAEAQASELKNSKFAGTLMIAETAQEGGSYAEAITYFNKIIEQEPSCADAWLNKGICMVRTSKIGDLKIPEAISSWKAAIKCAKNPEAMKKRVAKEINNAVADFYPVLEQHYLEFRNVGKSMQEHGDRFLLLESALSFALELSPSLTIAKNGISLCDRFEASASQSGDELADRFLKGFKSTFNVVTAFLPSGPLKAKLANDSKGLEGALKLTRRKYEEVVARFDPECAKVFAARLEQGKKETQRAEFQIRAVKWSFKWCSIVGLGFLFVIMASVIVSGLSDPKPDLLVAGILAVVVLVKIMKIYKSLGTSSSQKRDTKASDEPK